MLAPLSNYWAGAPLFLRLCHMTLKMGFYRLQNKHYFNKKSIVDMDVVNDATCTHQSVITRVVKRLSFMLFNEL